MNWVGLLLLDSLFPSRQIARLTNFSNYTKRDYLQRLQKRPRDYAATEDTDFQAAPVVWFNSHLHTKVVMKSVVRERNGSPTLQKTKYGFQCVDVVV